MANVKICRTWFFTFLIFVKVRPVLTKVTHGVTDAETDKPITICEILQIWLKKLVAHWSAVRNCGSLCYRCRFYVQFHPRRDAGANRVRRPRRRQRIRLWNQLLLDDLRRRRRKRRRCHLRQIDVLDSEDIVIDQRRQSNAWDGGLPRRLRWSARLPSFIGQRRRRWNGGGGGGRRRVGRETRSMNDLRSGRTRGHLLHDPSVAVRRRRRARRLDQSDAQRRRASAGSVHRRGARRARPVHRRRSLRHRLRSEKDHRDELDSRRLLRRVEIDDVGRADGTGSPTSSIATFRRGRHDDGQAYWRRNDARRYTTWYEVGTSTRHVVKTSQTVVVVVARGQLDRSKSTGQRTRRH